MTDTLSRSTEPELAALDAYSQVVVSVAEQLTPGWLHCRSSGVAVTGELLPAQARRSCSRTTASC